MPAAEPALKPLLRLGFADMNAPAAAAWLAARPQGEPFGYVVTPNADHLVRLHRDAELAEIYHGALLLRDNLDEKERQSG
jgi:UDP-N-acetyl-D-mannosaminuronic acid transferase (WecB/TagA/CpsF family)